LMGVRAGFPGPYFQHRFKIEREKMKRDQKAALVLSLGMMVLGVYGCGEKKIVTTDVPNTPEMNAAEKGPAPMGKYTVKKGDTLWAISQKTGIYSDSFQWPLIFKTDRDQIQDPDQIVPGQVLSIQKGPSAAQIKRARQLASDTPVFVPHAGPRSPLPVDYF